MKHITFTLCCCFFCLCLAVPLSLCARLATPVSTAAAASAPTAVEPAAQDTPTPLPLHPGTPLLVLMYHQFLRTSSSDYIVTPELFRQDLRALKARGYTSVTANQVIGYVYHKVALPEKPVLITIDDGHYSQMHYAYSILKDEGFTALSSVVGKFSAHTSQSGDSKNPNYSHLTWDEIRELAASGVFEFGNHTYNMHGYIPRFGISQKVGESSEQYRHALTDDLMTLQNVLTQQCGVTPNVFAIPFGKYNKRSITFLQEMGFKMILTCNEGITTVRPSDPSTLTLVKRYNRSPNRSLSAILDYADRRFLPQ